MPFPTDTSRADAAPAQPERPEASRSANAPLGEHLRQSSGSYELVFSVAILSLGGLWLDRRLGSTPWLTIIVAVLAFIGSVASQYYRYKDRIARLQAETAELKAKARTK